MGVEEIEAKIEAIQSQIERYEARGDDVEPLNIELQRAERRLAKEEAKLPVHPA
jgi:prefoldin subunit 5